MTASKETQRLALRWPTRHAATEGGLDRLRQARIRFTNGTKPEPKILVAGQPEKFTEHPRQGILRMGAFSYCQGFSDALSAAAVEIGRYCSIAQAVKRSGTNHPLDWVSSHPFQYSTSRFLDPEFFEFDNEGWQPGKFDLNGQGIRIGNDVWIGEGVIVNEGVSIGDGAVVFPRAVVTKDVPSYAIVGGIPAKVVRMRFDERTVERFQRARWWQYHFCRFVGPRLDRPAEFLAWLEDSDLPVLAETRVDVRALLDAPTPGQASCGRAEQRWDEVHATQVAHAAGLAGKSWVMGPEELAHVLNTAWRRMGNGRVSEAGK